MKGSKTPINENLLNIIAPMILKFETKGIQIGENLARCFIISKYPSSLEYGWLGKLSNVQGVIMLSEFIPQAEGMLISALSKNIADNKVRAISERDDYKRMQAEKRVEDGQNILRQIEENGESIGIMSNVMLVLGNSEEALKKNSEKLINTAIGLGCNVRQIPFFQEDGFITISPYGHTTEIMKELAGRVTLLSTYIGGFFNLSEGFSDEQGFYFAKDINGKLMIMDLWKRGGDRTNSNIVAVGAPGKGKSTAIKKIILNEYMLGTKILIVDPEREYDTIVKSLGGDWINLGGSNKGNINPLEIKPISLDDSENDNDEQEFDGVGALALHLQNLEVFFGLCLAEITERQKTILNDNLIKLYNKFNIDWDTDVSELNNEDFPIMTDLYEMLLKNKELEEDKKTIEDYNDLILYIGNLINGQDQFLFNKHTSLHTESRIICLDTYDLNNSSERIKKAQYFNIISWCWQQITKDRHEKIMLICDEAYLLIDPEIPQTLIGLRNNAKRCRKYEGALVVISQSIIDFLDPRIKMYGQALLTLPCYKIFLGSDGKDLQEIVDVFELKQIHKDIIQAGVQGRGLLINGSKHYIFNMELADYEAKYILGGKGGR